MSTPHELPDLEQTLTELVVELLLLEKEHRFSHLILGDPESVPAARISMHYVMALLAYGFTIAEQEVKSAADWFDRPFPKNPTDEVDKLEMNRLMVLLHLRPHNENVAARLRQLAFQRERSRLYFDIQSGWSEFDTLWALEAFITAWKAGVLDEQVISIDDIRRSLHNLITSPALRADKDIAQALNLQVQAFGGLETAHESRLTELLQSASENDGVWGLGEFSHRRGLMEWYHEFIEGRPLTYDIIKPNEKRFRKVISSNCMVIEYLMPLIEAYPQLREPLDKAMHRWWDQFHGHNAVSMLRNLFPPPPNDYDYLLVLCRTLRSVKGYIGRQHKIDTVYLLRQITEFRTNINESYEMRSIKKALRSWIQVDLRGQGERLRLGYSEANVVRVHPHIWSPLANPEEEPESLIKHSLVIKYGPVQTVQQERLNYEKLPHAIRDFFVRIPEASYTDPDSGLAFVIMQDLRDYKTLYEAHEAVAEQVEHVADQFGTFLKDMHEGGTSVITMAPASLLRELYLSRMLEHVDRVFEFLWRYPFTIDHQRARDIQQNLFSCIGQFVTNPRPLETFPAAQMHGDLHLRNIMITGLDNAPNRRSPGVRFKLIDLENVRSDGDAAFDIGELMVDIQLFAKYESKLDNRSNKLLVISTTLNDIYKRFAESRSDENFGTRLNLAKARALLRISKGKVKRGASYAESGQIAQAQRIADEVVDHVEESLSYLQMVTKAIQEQQS